MILRILSKGTPSFSWRPQPGHSITYVYGEFVVRTEPSAIRKSAYRRIIFRAVFCGAASVRKRQLAKQQINIGAERWLRQIQQLGNTVVVVEHVVNYVEISDEVREQLKVTQKPEMYRTTWKDRLKFQLKVRLCIGAVLLVMMVIVIIIMAITEMF